MVSSKLRLTLYNSRILFNFNVLAALVLTVLAPFIFSFELLSYREVAKLCELYFSILGIVLFAYIGNIENQEQAKELINVRVVPYWTILLIRKLLVLLLTFMLVASILIYGRIRGSVFPFWEMAIGTVITAAYLGSIAYSIANLTNQVSSGYIIAFAYYLLEYSTKGKYTCNMYLFSLMRMEFTPKYYLLAATIMMLIANLIYIHRFKSKLNTIMDM